VLSMRAWSRAHERPATGEGSKLIRCRALPERCYTLGTVDALSLLPIFFAT
jgi:hypothetical protein